MGTLGAIWHLLHLTKKFGVSSKRCMVWRIKSSYIPQWRGHHKRRWSHMRTWPSCKYGILMGQALLIMAYTSQLVIMILSLTVPDFQLKLPIKSSLGGNLWQCYFGSYLPQWAVAACRASQRNHLISDFICLYTLDGCCAGPRGT